MASLLAAFPRGLVVAVAGLALLSTIGGVGSAFWGLVAGAVALLVQQWRK